MTSIFQLLCLLSPLLLTNAAAQEEQLESEEQEQVEEQEQASTSYQHFAQNAIQVATKTESPPRSYLPPKAQQPQVNISEIKFITCSDTRQF